MFNEIDVLYRDFGRWGQSQMPFEQIQVALLGWFRCGLLQFNLDLFVAGDGNVIVHFDSCGRAQ